MQATLSESGPPVARAAKATTRSAGGYIKPPALPGHGITLRRECPEAAGWRERTISK